MITLLLVVTFDRNLVLLICKQGVFVLTDSMWFLEFFLTHL